MNSSIIRFRSKAPSPTRPSPVLFGCYAGRLSIQIIEIKPLVVEGASGWFRNFQNGIP
jgi:hypothetical protein